VRCVCVCVCVCVCKVKSWELMKQSLSLSGCCLCIWCWSLKFTERQWEGRCVLIRKQQDQAESQKCWVEMRKEGWGEICVRSCCLNWGHIGILQNSGMSLCHRTKSTLSLGIEDADQVQAQQRPAPLCFSSPWVSPQMAVVELSPSKPLQEFLYSK
jgi:hypothetical protein